MNTDHIEDVRGMVPVAWGAFHFGGSRNGKLYAQCDTKDQIETYIAQIHQSNDSITLRAAPLYTHPADCPRCAELEPVVHAIGNFIGREYLVAWTDKFLSDIVIQLLTERDKQIAALEAENKQLTERIKQIDTLLTRNLLTHELFQTGDPSCPEQALDWNGEVALGICKNCGRVEVELDEPCDHRNLIASLRAENARMKAELKSIEGALDDPRANLTLTTAEIIWELKAQLATSPLPPTQG